MLIPNSTYRVQLHSGFTLEDLRENLEYLHDLGVSTIYASPIFKSREGSTHGYDVLDPYTIDPEIGTLEIFRSLVESLKQKKMTWLQDIVPNHMAFDSDNPWLREIFELGPESDHYRKFDIDWERSGKLMAPFLGAEKEEVLEKGELKIDFHENGFSWKYFTHSYPLSARSYFEILKQAEIGNWLEKFQDFSGNINQWEDLRIGFFREVREDMALRDRIKTVLETMNASSEKLRMILELQYFDPVHWKKTEQEINYRRFFTINDLICLRAEDPQVLENYHYYLKELCEQGMISGLRIDHIDGLYDPAGYLVNLKEFIKTDPYIVVEKIQEAEEALPSDWPIQGSTGYEFLAKVNQVFTSEENESEFTANYAKIAPEFSDYEKLVFTKKQYVLTEEMGGEFQNLLELLRAKELLPENDKLKEEDLKQALGVYLAAFPVYRLYPKEFPLSTTEKELLQATYNEALKRAPEREEELTYIRSLFMGEAEKDPENMLDFLKRSQQFTGPLAAKGVEDTVFYLYNRLLSHNEVGDSPEVFGLSAAAFHEKMQERQQSFPHSLNATATHDTKRGEDARMRLNVLSELPKRWFEKVKEWQELHAPLKDQPQIPDPNEELFIYQTLVGHYPLDKEQQKDFLTRLQEYLQKALREGKLHSSWGEPDEEYETAFSNFAEAILQQKEFLKSFRAFHEEIAAHGAIKSLGQTLLKLTAPGIPDVYQGTEFWDLSFVDPDNRRPVDYNIRKSLLSDFKRIASENIKEHLNSVKSHWQDGKIKLYLLYKGLAFRKEYPELFSKGEYYPLTVKGKNADKLLAYARNHNSDWVLVIAPLFTTESFDPEKLAPQKHAFSDCELLLPENAPEKWQNLFSGTQYQKTSSSNVQLLLEEFPVALLKNLDK